MLWSGVAHSAECKIEEWTWSSPLPTVLIIEGVTTCESGELILRLYRGEGGSFFGVERDYIEGHTFKVIRTATQKPKSLAIKYVIKAR